MKIQTIPLGFFGANCYLLTDAQGNCVLIDPADAKPLVNYMSKQGVSLRAILLTHGHFDHIWGVAGLKKATGAPVYCHAADVELLHCPELAAGSFGDIDCPPCDADVQVKDGDTLEIGEMQFTFLHTPGHSKGSVSILTPDGLFTGDTLFAGSIGRSDLYGGDSKVLMQSVRKLSELAFDGNVYPGHGGATTLERERRSNPYVIAAQKGKL